MNRASKQLLTVQEAEARGPWKASTWRKKILRREVPFVKAGKSVRIPLEALEKIVADGWHEPIIAEAGGK